VEYPPLKTFQCVLLIDKPFLHNVNTTLWVDNLYIAVARTRTQPDFSILEHGNVAFGPRQVGGKSLYITSSTFVGEGRGSARAILAQEPSARVLVEGGKEPCLPDAFKLI
jgi:hypothetical protein